jgi:DNA modification methylase
MSAVTILTGDCREVLRTLADASVNCCVTSPPYWGLRDYGHAGQIGLERTPETYVAEMVAVFREVKRVLRDDGTLWLNLGDSYWGGKGQSNYAFQDRRTSETLAGQQHNIMGMGETRPQDGKHDTIKPKDLVGIPWRVAFALQADGWWLRSDIIWHKPNPMPESVTDRPTKSHEYIFLLTKSDRYYYDAKAIAEPVMQSSLVRAESGVKFGGNNLCPDTRLQSGKVWIPKAEGENSRMNRSRDPAHSREYAGKNRSQDDQASGRRMLKNVQEARANGGDHDAPFGVTRNKRSVWTVATQAYKDAHFATFPPALIVPCILAGCPPGGTVLDPFGGSGTVGEVASGNGRKAILIELNPEYVKLQQDRCGLFCQG